MRKPRRQPRLSRNFKPTSQSIAADSLGASWEDVLSVQWRSDAGDTFRRDEYESGALIITRDGEVIDTRVIDHLPEETLAAFVDHCARAGSLRTTHIDAARECVRRLLRPMREETRQELRTDHLYRAGFLDVCSQGEFLWALIDEGYQIWPKLGEDWALVNAEPVAKWQAFPPVKLLTKERLRTEIATLAARAFRSDDPEVRATAKDFQAALRAMKPKLTTTGSACLLK